MYVNYPVPATDVGRKVVVMRERIVMERRRKKDDKIKILGNLAAESKSGHLRRIPRAY